MESQLIKSIKRGRKNFHCGENGRVKTEEKDGGVFVIVKKQASEKVQNTVGRGKSMPPVTRKDG